MAWTRRANGDFNIDEFLLRLDKAAIEHALAVTNGSPARAARILDINRTTLLQRAKRYEIDIEEFRDFIKPRDDEPMITAMRRQSRPVPVIKTNLRYHMLEHIVAVLRENDWNRTHASNDLGISVRALRYMIQEAVQAGFYVGESQYAKNRRR